MFATRTGEIIDDGDNQGRKYHISLQVADHAVVRSGMRLGP
jgi:hypothetical protein